MRSMGAYAPEERKATEEHGTHSLGGKAILRSKGAIFPLPMSPPDSSMVWRSPPVRLA